MREFALKICLFLFLASLLARRTELGVMTGAVTGTILLWPLYRKWVGLPGDQRPPRPTVERGDRNLVAANSRPDKAQHEIWG
jgi:hypothetical protein